MKNRFKTFVTFLLFLCFSLSQAAYADTQTSGSAVQSAETAVQTSSASLPVIVSPSAILVEAETGKVLYDKNSDAKMYPASMTKIMTSLVLLDNFKPDDIITVGSEINEVTLDSSKAGHTKGESITVENLVRGLLIPSGNDSAVVAATAVAKKTQNNNSLSEKDCEKAFADLMNKKAAELGCKNTHFSNPHGYHSDDHYTCASDMALIAQAAVKNDTIKEIGSEQSFSGNGLGSQKASHPELKSNDYKWTSHNMLITDNQYKYEYATGLKTGFTDEAGDCVTATAQKDGVTLIAVIFNSPDPGRWLDAAALFNYGYENFGFCTLGKAGDVIGSASLVYNKSSEGDKLDLVLKDDISVFAAKNDVSSAEKKITITNTALIPKNNETDENGLSKLMAPVAKDTEIGTVDYKAKDGTVLASAKLYAGRDVSKANILGRAFYKIKTMAKHFTSGKTLVKAAIFICVIAAIIIILILFFKGQGRRRNYYSRPVYRYKPRRRKKW